MNLALIGYRGTGKSVVGKRVATRLGMTYVSLDERIVAAAGMPINQIVAEQGWPAFRDLETQQIKEIAWLDNTVIDTGGGIIERPENIAILRANAYLVWLKASVATIVARISHDNARPSLTGAQSFTEEVAEVLARRTPAYRAAADYELDTDQLNREQVADAVVTLWQQHLAQNS
jgi:shikimate kinase